MTDQPLSPAAQAVRHVAICAGPELEGRIAAALRTAAVYCTRERRILLTIADELEGGND
jgi:hypothetical protein